MEDLQAFDTGSAEFDFLLAGEVPHWVESCHCFA